jgi:UDP-N-acetylmuramate--alanine ligase
MKVVVLGGGPAGLYLAISMKLRDASHDVLVLVTGATGFVGRHLVAVAGAHGKTTTCGMIGWALEKLGRNPTVFVGGKVLGWNSNFRAGEDPVVMEADEYDRAFLSLEPHVAVVTNVEADHLECYGTLDALEEAFATFAGRAAHVLVGADDGGAKRVAAGLGGKVWTVGTSPGADVRITDVRARPAGTTALVELPGAPVTLSLAVPGAHNVRNAAMALAVVAALEADVEAAAGGLARFGGVGRRFETVGETSGITIVDDYAHHPTEVAATLGAARQRYPEARLVAVFQPHLYSRTKVHGKTLGIALAVADVVVVTEVYAARERPIAGVSGRRVHDAAARAGAETHWVPDRAAVAAAVEDLVRRGDVVLTLGAGDITEVGPDLLDRLRGRAA